MITLRKQKKKKNTETGVSIFRGELPPQYDSLLACQKQKDNSFLQSWIEHLPHQDTFNFMI